MPPTSYIDETLPRYPPFIRGLPIVPIEKVLATQGELIERLSGALGYTRTDFAQLVAPVLARYAAFVHFLPASETHHHRGAGGLLRHGLEVAFWAAQASDALIFSMEGTPRERRESEPRWRLATCFAGLLHDVGKPLADLSVTDKSGHVIWNPYTQMLTDWASDHDVQRYFIHWRAQRYKRHQTLSILMVERILPSQTLTYLGKSGPKIVAAMLAAIADMNLDQPIAKLVLQADQASVAQDLRQSHLEQDAFAYGMPIERYVFDAMRRLIQTAQWKVNVAGAIVWYFHQGVFVRWKLGIHDLYQLLDDDHIPGIPKDPDTLADILIERGFALPCAVTEKGETASYRYWEVIPEGLPTDSVSIKPTFLMLRLASPDLVFTTEPPTPAKAKIVDHIDHEEIALSALTSKAEKIKASQKAETKEVEIESVHSQPDKVLSEPCLRPTEVLTEQCASITKERTQHNDKDEIEPHLDPKAVLEKLISTYREAADILKEAIWPTLDGKQVLGEVIELFQHNVAILYPEGVQKLGIVAEVTRQLSQANAIVSDSILLGRKVQECNGRKVLMLAKPLSEAIIAALNELAHNEDIATAKKAYQGVNQHPYQKKRFGNQEEQRPSFVLSKPAAESALREESRSTTNKTTTLLVDTQPILLSHEDTSKNQDDKETCQQSELNVLFTLKPETQPEKEHLEDMAFTPQITYERAIQMLKTMIQERNGRWLVTPVMQEDIHLVTSDHALDRMIEAHPELGNQYQLRNRILLDRHTPLLRIQAGQLRLKIKE